MDDTVADIAGVNTEPYLKLALGDQIWTPTVKMPGSTCDFTVFDPEQRLHISVWDKDLSTQDDLLGQLGPYSMADAMAVSEEASEVRGVEGERFGMIRLKFEW